MDHGFSFPGQKNYGPSQHSAARNLFFGTRRPPSVSGPALNFSLLSLATTWGISKSWMYDSFLKLICLQTTAAQRATMTHRMMIIDPQKTRKPKPATLPPGPCGDAVKRPRVPQKESSFRYLRLSSRTLRIPPVNQNHLVGFLTR